MLNSKDFITAMEIISKHHSTELVINTPSNNFVGFIAIEVYKDDFDWVCELLDYTENPDNTREQLLEFYNYARTEYKDLEGYPEYI